MLDTPIPYKFFIECAVMIGFATYGVIHTFKWELQQKLRERKRKALGDVYDEASRPSKRRTRFFTLKRSRRDNTHSD